MSLPSSYDTLVISLDSHLEKDDLDFVIGRLLNEEIRQEFEHSAPLASSPATALAARTYRDKSRVTVGAHYFCYCSTIVPLAHIYIFIA
jgi:hypothetical protein